MMNKTLIHLKSNSSSTSQVNVFILPHAGGVANTYVATSEVVLPTTYAFFFQFSLLALSINIVINNNIASLSIPFTHLIQTDITFTYTNTREEDFDETKNATTQSKS